MTTRRALLAMIGATALFTIASLVEGVVAMVVTDGLSLGAIVLALWGARRQPARCRVHWFLIAAGLAAWLVGDLIWDAYRLGSGEAPEGSAADVAYLLGYPILAAGIVSMIRRRSATSWRAGLLDAVGVAMASALAAWVFLVPAGGAGSTMTRALAIAYPLGDVVLLAALAWLVLAPGIRGVPSAFIIAGFLGNLVLDVLLSIDAIAERTIGGWFDNAYPLTYLMIALALSHQRSAELTLPDPDPSEHLRPARVVFLGIALFSGPVIGTFGGSTSGTHRILVLATTLGIGTIVLTRFMTALREVEASRRAISVVAGTDMLTGLDNRRRFLESGERTLERLQAEHSSTGALMIDIDHFKQINDTFGHAAGDAVLAEISRRCLAAVRPFDLIGRLGGDEFALVLPGCDASETRHVADRIAGLVSARPVTLADGQDIDVTLSIGGAAGNFRSMHFALAEADAALYEAKRQGRGRLWMAETTVDLATATGGQPAAR